MLYSLGPTSAIFGNPIPQYLYRFSVRGDLILPDPEKDGRTHLGYSAPRPLRVLKFRSQDLFKKTGDSHFWVDPWGHLLCLAAARRNAHSLLEALVAWVLGHRTLNSRYRRWACVPIQLDRVLNGQEPPPLPDR